MTPTPGPLSPDARLRDELATLLAGGHAHVPLADAVSGVHEARVNERPDGMEHSLWDLLWHVRFTQADLLEFVRSDRPGGTPYIDKAWPDDYWPDRPAAPGEWDAQVEALLRDTEAFQALVRDPFVSLTAEFAAHPGYTVLREALLAATHASYHAGQIVDVRRRLGLWPSASGG